MNFADQIAAFNVKVQARRKDIFVGTATECLRSIVEGSEITGAPGSPVDTGHLKSGWQLTFPSEHEAEITNNVDYALYVEDNVNNVTFTVGGPHSVALTRSGFERIVDHVTAEVGEV